MSITAYALRRPDGTYLTKRGYLPYSAKGKSDKLGLKCLYTTKQAMRQSYGLSIRVDSPLGRAVAFAGWDKEKEGLFGSRYSRVIQELRQMRTETFFRLLEEEGYKVLEINIKLDEE